MHCHTKKVPPSTDEICSKTFIQLANLQHPVRVFQCNGNGRVNSFILKRRPDLLIFFLMVGCYNIYHLSSDSICFIIICSCPSPLLIQLVLLLTCTQNNPVVSLVRRVRPTFWRIVPFAQALLAFPSLH